MVKLVEVIAKALVDQPDAVEVKEYKENNPLHRVESCSRRYGKVIESKEELQNQSVQ